MPQSRGPSDGLKAGWGPAAGPQARLLVIHAWRSSVKEATLVPSSPRIHLVYPATRNVSLLQSCISNHVTDVHECGSSQVR